MVDKSHGALKVIVDLPSHGQGQDEPLVTSQPLFVLEHKVISLFDRSDGTQALEECPELSSSQGGRVGPEPSHALSLDMVKASLNTNHWPYCLKGPHCALFSIHGDVEGVKAILLKVFKPPINLVETFFKAIDGVNNSLLQGIHEDNKAAILVKVGAIVKEVFDTRDIFRKRGFFGEPMVNNPLDLGMTVS